MCRLLMAISVLRYKFCPKLNSRPRGKKKKNEQQKTHSGRRPGKRKNQQQFKTAFGYTLKEKKGFLTSLWDITFLRRGAVFYQQ